MDQQWRLFTEHIRREILTNSKIRKIVISFANSSVNESLPIKFIDELSSDNKIEKLKKRYSNRIASYLSLDPVPENQITPDIMNAKSLVRPRDTIETLQSVFGIDTPEFYEQLKKFIDSGSFLEGITAHERLIIAQRYRFTRDVKLLVLQAEVCEQKEKKVKKSSQEITLPSGTTININVTDEKIKQELLNPQNWEKRRQIKDRVYEIEVGGSKYILKEKKIARHIHTKRHGHKPGLTSLEEYQTAQHFQEKGIVEQGNIKVNWEKPVASVLFTDGFQFTIFEHEEGLIEENAINQRLSQEIIERREQFMSEFEAVKTMANKFKNDPRVLTTANRNTELGLKAIYKWIKSNKNRIPELTFEEFATIKALRMERVAKRLMQEIIIGNGYENNDTDGYSFKINIKEDGKIQIEIVGFDFEYFSKIDQDMVDSRLKQFQELEQEWENRDGIGFLYWDDGSPVTGIQNACYFAMLTTEGILFS